MRWTLNSCCHTNKTLGVGTLRALQALQGVSCLAGLQVFSQCRRFDSVSMLERFDRLENACFGHLPA